MLWDASFLLPRISQHNGPEAKDWGVRKASHSFQLHSFPGWSVKRKHAEQLAVSRQCTFWVISKLGLICEIQALWKIRESASLGLRYFWEHISWKQVDCTTVMLSDYLQHSIRPLEVTQILQNIASLQWSQPPGKPKPGGDPETSQCQANGL